jgi:hypothetical protein
MSIHKPRYAPEITDTSGWFRNLSTDKLHCGLCLPASVALVRQAEPMRRYLNTKLGDFYVLQSFQIEGLAPKEIEEHKACAE